jgi:hypothetical protein
MRHNYVHSPANRERKIVEETEDIIFILFKINFNLLQYLERRPKCNTTKPDSVEAYARYGLKPCRQHNNSGRGRNIPGQAR